MTLRWTSFYAFLLLSPVLLLLVRANVVEDSSSDSSSSAIAAMRNDPPSRGLQTEPPCSTICPNGADMTSGDSILPIFPDGPKTCTAADALLAAQDPTACAIVSTFVNFLDVAAYCGCTGSSPPAVCTGCSAGGQVTKPDTEFTEPLFNLTFSCRQAANFVSYLTNDFACSGFTGLFDTVCCTSSSSGNPTAPTAGGGTTSAPAATPTMTTSSPSGSAPSSVTVPTAPTAGMPTSGEGPSASPYPSATTVPTAPGAPSSSTVRPSISTMPASGPTPASPTSPSAPTAPTSTSGAVSITGSYVGAVAVVLTVVLASNLYVG